MTGTKKKKTAVSEVSETKTPEIPKLHGPIGTDLKDPIYFHVSLVAERSNPNGDPMDEGRPRVTEDGLGMITNVCLARKIRDAALRAGASVLMQSDSMRIDEHVSVQERMTAAGISTKDSRETIKRALCSEFFDVRLRGATVALPSAKKGEEKGFSLGIRQALSLTDALSSEPVKIERSQITRSHNMAEGLKDGEKGSETMGMRYVVERGVYTFFGSVTPYSAAVTGFSLADAEFLKNILPKMLDDDVSLNRPSGSFYVRDIIWWNSLPDGERVNPGRLYKAAVPNSEGELEIIDAELKGLKPERLKVW